ncbi:PI-PLC X domain-containing protein [Ceratocystis platani]|uniref:PI-PLC X domain-containing protein n=1 Tax=Ceratocystis fimbriata f. sp. platani TaxID=88771 RepID=A0A0F8CRH3_CERFI|nr:PI-PLC X domain-containing protein [Ceratocystis platani]
MRQPWPCAALVLLLSNAAFPLSLPLASAISSETVSNPTSTSPAAISAAVSVAQSASDPAPDSSGQDSETAFPTAQVTTLRGTKTLQSSTPPSNAYSDYTVQVTLTYPSTTKTNNHTTRATSSVASSTGLNSTNTTTTINTTATTATTTSAIPSSTRPCNNYIELCSRKYSSVTDIGCHNSPFVRRGSSAANQQLPVTDQLNDGVRFLQAQIQWPTNADATGQREPHFCHTSCDILDAGPISIWLSEVRAWIDAHPYDVVTILLGNGNYSHPDLFAQYIENSGITRYAYMPPLFPMKRNDWPTLGQMIAADKRVVMFLDYQADQSKYPWLLQQFSQMWETPFDPEDQSFPCTVDRPPNLAENEAQERLYLVNHNLNVKYSFFGASVLAPAVSLLNQTNNNQGNGSLGMTAENCRRRWGIVPKVLNVDFYNIGGEYNSGAVFKVAAAMNNVTYTGSCCGTVTSSSAQRGVTVGLGRATRWLSILVALAMANTLSA